MAAVNRNQMLSALDARFKSMLLEAKGGIPKIGEDLVTVQKTDRAYELYNRFVGFGEAAEVAEGAVFPEKEIKQASSVTVQPKKFGCRVDVTREMVVDNLFDSIAGTVARSLRNSMEQARERRILGLFNNGFASTTTFDGQYLFATGHVLTQGGTQSNTSTAAALDIDQLWTGINTMKTTVGNSGLYDALYLPKYLVGPQALERRMYELLKSEWVPQVTENQVNALPMLYNMSIKTSPLLSSSTAWFLVANPSELMQPSLVCLDREPLTVNALFDVSGNVELGSSVDLDIYSWRVRQRYEAAAIAWLGLFGNSGA